MGVARSSTKRPFSHMTIITLPDGSNRAFDTPVTGFEIANSISKSLAKQALAIEVDGQLCDLDLPIEADAKVRLIKKEDRKPWGSFAMIARMSWLKRFRICFQAHK